MHSNNEHDEPPPPYSPRLTFHDPFATLQGGIGSLTINTTVSSSHASTTQCTPSDEDLASTLASSYASDTSPTSPFSGNVSPKNSQPLGDNGEEGTLPPKYHDSRDNVFLELDALVTGRPECADYITPRRSHLQQSFDGAESIVGSHAKTGRQSIASFRSLSGTEASNAHSADVLCGDDWNIETLRNMTDAVREALKAGTIPAGAMETLSEVLRAVLVDEESPKPVDINLVALTYFDKLLDAIITSPKTRNIEAAEPGFQDVHAKATSLQHKWQQRFKEKYFSIDDYRISDMMEVALRDMTLDVADWKTDQPWRVSRSEPISHLEGDLGFEPGSWWLNMACAFRDGIVGGVHDMATKGPYIVTALPLLSGEEREGPTLNQYEYIKRGTIKDMPFGVLGNKKGPVRILRGHMLKSKFAPTIGVRYDGLYTVKQYGHKLVDENSNIYQCTLILERVTGQKAMNEILEYPAPSQVDDWALYNRIVGDHVRARQGDVAYSEWRDFQDAQKANKEVYIQKESIRGIFPKYKVVKRTGISSCD